MKLGLFSAAFPNTPLEQLTGWAAENGFEMLEIVRQASFVQSLLDALQIGPVVFTEPARNA